MASARQQDDVPGGSPGEVGLLGWLLIKTLLLIQPWWEQQDTQLPGIVWAVGQWRLALTLLPGQILARCGWGGGSSLLAWQLPALPTAPFDPARESQNPVSACLLRRNHEKTAMPRIRKEPVYIFGRVDESIELALFILVNVLWIVRNFH